jgi:hypothetical protein
VVTTAPLSQFEPMAKKKSAIDKGAAADVETPYQVFISHATADKWLATTICEKIEAIGATTFRDDRDIKGGDDIPEEILRHIEESKEVLVLLTPESITRPWVMVEVGAAWALREKRIVAILHYTSFDTIPAVMKSKKAFPLNDFDRYLDELEKRVRGTHGKTGHEV